ncbi:exported hypothetical protein [uncultured Desulfobacterium sp.]|uniref:DUF1566 domain-containing protein n=1 Tax=uncultured Desulfobacterium sp. TaxID=201089 RepID=A0A445N3H7_9BACT|nr:exported hypothetical protein [uncultured Desulfobacterium sp.]
MQKMKKSKQILLMSVLLAVTWPFLAFAGEVSLPKTGQTTCYDESGNVIDCGSTGQDGDIQAGVDWPEPRFVDNGDGTVTDHLTGLIWLKNAGCAGKMTWDAAVTYSNSLASGTCGLTDGSVAGDWRLPNIVELESLVNAERANSATWLNSQGFTNVQSSGYWSATTYAGNTGIAWVVYMNHGDVNRYNKTFSPYYAWPVRGGQNGPAQAWQTGQKTSYAAGDDGDLEKGVAWPDPRFTDNANGTVTDNLTGLIWLKNATCAGYMTWNNALNFCNNLSSGSYGLSDGSAAGDWRLPNRKELLSLIDYSRCDPAIPQGHPFLYVESDSYWSATTVADYTGCAWIVGMGNGRVDYGNKTLNGYDRYVWPVRGGQCGSLGNLTISYPNGGETLSKGANYTITWNSTDITGTVKIELYKGGTTSGNKVLEIASAAENNGVCTFIPPFSLADGTDYYLGISAESGTVTDFSDSAFSVATMPNLTITYPNGGEKLTKGGNYTITWDSTSVTGSVAIGLYKSGTEAGNIVLQLAAATDNDGQYTFTPSFSLEDGSDYYIGITAEMGAVTDFSNSSLSIGSAPDPACVSQKVKTASTLCTALINCWVKEIKDVKGKYEVKDFTGLATQKFGIAWDKAQNKAVGEVLNCDAGSAEEIGVTINDALEDIYNQINSETDQGNKNSVSLGSTLLKAAGKRCSSLLKARSAYIKDKAANKDAKLDAAIAKANTAFSNSFNKAKAKAAKKGLTCDDSIKTYLEGAINDLESNILSAMEVTAP